MVRTGHFQKHFFQSVLLVSFGAVFFLYSNCSEVRLNRRLDPVVTVTSVGELCLNNEGIVRENKILFIIDRSGSNASTDPNDLRRLANIEAFFEKYQNDVSMSWGFIVFNNNRADVLTKDPLTGLAGFGDSADMMRAIAAYRALPNVGSTPYQLALDVSRQMIDADLKSYPKSQAIYNLFFMSDGQPSDPGPFVANSPTDPYIVKVKDLIKVAPGRVFLSTAFYDPASTPSDPGPLGLKYMAEAGQGKFANLQSSDLLDFDSIRATPLVRPLMIKGPRINMVNLNSGFCLDGSIDADSDSDGLCDKDELMLSEKHKEFLQGRKFDPANRNSLNQSYSDFFFYKMSVLGGETQLTCGGKGFDEDFDLLNECEEKELSDFNANGPTPQWTTMMNNEWGGFANLWNPDTDGDTFLDSLEFFQFGHKSAPLNYRNLFDRFDGGVTGETLMVEHRHPIRSSEFGAHSYDPVTKYVGKNSVGENCYTFKQNRLAVYSVMDHPNPRSDLTQLAHGRGENVVYLYYIAVPEDDPNGLGSLHYSFQRVRIAEPSIEQIRYDRFQSYKIESSGAP